MEIGLPSWIDRSGKAVALGLGSLALAVLCACQPITPPPPAPAATSIPAAVQGEPAAAGLGKIRESWASSKHAKTYVIQEGKNNDCARCHSPLNWMPTSMDDMPATCASCKFNISTPKPVAEAEWKSVSCEQCHRADKGAVSSEVAWLNAAVAQYDTSADPYQAVKSSNELCEKCHRDGFKIDLGTSAHAGKTCTDCHDAHSTQATCSTDTCHANVTKADKPLPGHDAAHAKVTCSACHDAAKLQVGPTADASRWVTWRSSPVSSKQELGPFASHNMQRQVECSRCHFEGNTWGLASGKSYTPGAK